MFSYIFDFEFDFETHIESLSQNIKKYFNWSLKVSTLTEKPC